MNEDENKCLHGNDEYNCRECDYKADREHEFTEPTQEEL